MVNFQPYQPCVKSYEDYYLNQAGHGINYFIGRPHQRGRNGFATLLRGVGRMLIPLVKSGGKKILKEGVKTGINIAGDVLSGQNIKSAVKKRAKQTGKRLLTDAFGQLAGTSFAAPPGQPAAKRIKRKINQSKRQSKKRQYRGNVNQQDIFH